MYMHVFVTYAMPYQLAMYVSMIVGMRVDERLYSVLFKTHLKRPHDDA